MEVCVNCKKNLNDVKWVSKGIWFRSPRKRCLECDKKITKNIILIPILTILLIGNMAMILLGLLLMINSINDLNFWLPWLIMFLIGIIILIGNIFLIKKIFKKENKENNNFLNY